MLITSDCYLYIYSLNYRGVGCIFFEMASGRPLFPGSPVEEELNLITRILGPLNSPFPSEPVHETLISRAPRLHQDGIYLLKSFLVVFIHIIYCFIFSTNYKH